ncbi:MAG: hypothetical protein L3J82_01090 [Planctomycetes bacterium]|nr:hypothetical protein [Planctomycetota bacterium]
MYICIIMEDPHEQLWELFSNPAYEELELGGTGKPHEAAALKIAMNLMNAKQLATEWTPDLEITLMQSDGLPFLILNETYIGLSVKGSESIAAKIKTYFTEELKR